MTCTGCPALGINSKFLIEPGASAHVFDSNSYRIPILREDFTKEGRLVGFNQMSGYLYPDKDRVRTGGSYYYGGFTINPSPGEFERLLPYLVGPDAGGGVFTPGTCPEVFGVLIDRDRTVLASENTFTYSDCQVSEWTLRGRAPEFREQGEPDLLTLDVRTMGLAETVSAGWPNPEPSLPTGLTYTPYMIQDSDTAVTISGATRKIYEFVINWKWLMWQPYYNSLTPLANCALGRQVTMGFRLPWTDANDDLYDMAYTGAAASVKFTIGAFSTLFSAANFKVPPNSPRIQGRQGVFFEINGQCYGTGSTVEMTVTNDVTP